MDKDYVTYDCGHRLHRRLMIDDVGDTVTAMFHHFKVTETSPHEYKSQPGVVCAECWFKKCQALSKAPVETT